MIITLKEVKEYARIDIDEDDQLLQRLITAAEEYLKNATGKEYPETDENGNPVSYELEKISAAAYSLLVREKDTSRRRWGRFYLYDKIADATVAK